jgi:hypothetical protein
MTTEESPCTVTDWYVIVAVAVVEIRTHPGL